MYCPIETTLYGGKIAHMEWYNNFQLFREAGDGRCWPGGHASGGFTMLALYFVARRYQWRYSKAVLWGSLLLGFIYGTTRVLQGCALHVPHLLGRDLRSGWRACATALAFYGRARLDVPVLKKAGQSSEDALTDFTK